MYMACETPSNVILAAVFRAFRLLLDCVGRTTLLTLGIDRNAEELARLYSEQGRAV
ncbi:hypothetical protein BDW66DRAFT_126608 [Aspergillus desertorum]